MPDDEPDLNFFIGPVFHDGDWYVAASWAVREMHPDNGTPWFRPYSEPFWLGPMDEGQAEAVSRFVMDVVVQHDMNMRAVGEAKFR